MVPCLTLTCYICAFQHCTSDYSLQALTHTIVWGSQCTATSFKLSYAANWTLDFSDMLFLTDCAIINLATDAHVGISIGTCHKKISEKLQMNRCQHNSCPICCQWITRKITHPIHLQWPSWVSQKQIPLLLHIPDNQWCWNPGVRTYQETDKLFSY